MLFAYLIIPYLIITKKKKGAHGNEDEDMDHAIALSLSEEDQRKGKAIGLYYAASFLCVFGYF